MSGLQIGLVGIAWFLHLDVFQIVPKARACAQFNQLAIQVARAAAGDFNQPELPIACSAFKMGPAEKLVSTNNTLAT